MADTRRIFHPGRDALGLRPRVRPDLRSSSVVGGPQRTGVRLAPPPPCVLGLLGSRPRPGGRCQWNPGGVEGPGGMTMPGVEVRVEGLTKRYGRVTALDAVSIAFTGG